MIGTLAEPVAPPVLFKLPVTVFYEDTDAGGVVYYANYLKFMERARTRWLHTLGFDQQVLLQQQHTAFAVRSAELRFHAPARLGDELLVDVAIASVRRTALAFVQSVCLAERVLVSGKIEVVCVDSARFRPRAMPPALLQSLSGLD